MVSSQLNVGAIYYCITLQSIVRLEMLSEGLRTLQAKVSYVVDGHKRYVVVEASSLSPVGTF